MKHFIFIAVAGFFLTACSTSPSKIDTEHVALVNNYIAAVEAMDYDGMDKYLADDYVGRGPSRTDSINKADAIASWKENVTHLYKKIHYNRSQTAPVYIAEGPNRGHWVGNWAELQIEYQDGNAVTIWANTNYFIKDGKISKSLTFYNEADALRQLGYVFVPAAAAE